MTTDDPRRGPMPSSPNPPRPAQPAPPRQAQPGRPPQGPPPQVRPSLGKQPPPRPTPPPGAQAKQAGSLAYSAVPEPKRPMSPAAPTAPPAPAKESPVAAAPTSSRTASAGQSDINYLSIVALVLSGLGVTFPFGLWLGYRSRSQIDREGTIGRQFAVAAIIVGYLWLLALVLGVIAYLWILI